MAKSRLNLRMKFIAGLILFALALGVCISITLYFHFNSIMESEISQRSRMLLAQSNAVQEYVRSVLRPEMFATLPEDRFVLKAMSSSYISRQVMGRLNVKGDLTYLYRRVSNNPRNPEFKANEQETGLIAFFNENKGVSIWEDDSMVGDTAYHIVAQPVVFKSSCMNCHGDPEDAPKELLDIYGRENGFHNRVDEVGGVVVAGFPVDMIKNPVKEMTFRYLIFYITGILLFAALISLFFDQLVMKNLRALSSIFKNRFSGEQEVRIIDRLGEKDEIEGLIEGVDELAHCLSKARNELEDYALNLEKRVKERTEELNVKARMHRDDVALFVKMLTGFGGLADTGDLIMVALESIGRRFDAAQVIYHCTVASENAYVWKAEEKIQPLSDEVKNILWEDQVLLQGSRLYIPVKSQESHWGILSISWVNRPDETRIDKTMLLALGQQLAVLIENIQAFSNIRFQNDMLQSVFEGISDPLLLIDGEGRILMANTGSRAILPGKGRRDREKELKRFLNPGRQGGPDDIIHRLLAADSPLTQEISTKDDRFFRIFLYPLPSRNADEMRIVLYAREITMEKQMMARMHQAERLGAVGKVAAGIAHEINNPLGVISCYTDLVKDAVTEEQTLEDLEVIVKHTKNVQKIVQDLLKLSRPKQVLSGTCRINEVVTSLVKVFKAQSASKDIHVVFEGARDLPPIQCDTGILEQILTNLWINAFDSLHGTGGRVEIRTGPAGEGSQVFLSVEDNGPGIPDHVVNHIFDPFFTTKEVGKGTGLGLAVIYGFINELGGRIEVTSEETTSFTVYFPVQRRDP